MSEAVILDDIDATNGNHNGGTILFGPDGRLGKASVRWFPSAPRPPNSCRMP